MKHRLFILCFAILLTFLVACNAFIITSPTPAKISETSTKSFTFTQPPTNTPFPTFNLTEEAWMDTLDVTREAEIFSGEATQQINIALATQFPPTCNSYRDPSLSPDGNWLAVSCDIDEQIKITSRDGNKVLQIDYDTLFEPAKDSPDMFINTWIAHWSADNRYVYIDWSICCCWSGLHPGAIYPRK